jgi:hypothetical protein
MRGKDCYGGLAVGRESFHFGAEKLSHSYPHFRRDLLVTQGLHGLDGLLVRFKERDTVGAAAEVILERRCNLRGQFPAEIVSD